MTANTPSGLPGRSSLMLRTLGGAGLYSAEAPDQLILGPGKPLALLVYVALTPGHRISRDFLVDLLWGDVEPARGRNALRQALFAVRRLVGDHVLPGADELTLASRIDSDRDRFLSAVERGDLAGAVAEYAGPFLPDFGAPGGAAFERWADLERDRLRTAFLRCSELLVRRQLNESRVRDAQRLARRVRDELPHNEAAWRLVLETTIVGRDFVAAAVEADALETLAATEGMPLEPSTRAAIARARRVTPRRPDDDADELVADLTGREREFAAITAAWEASRGGRGRHVHLTAPAGLGKTRLLRDIATRVRAAGAKVVELRGAPGERDIPFAFAGDLALALAALPGSSGIAPASASALIALNPALSSHVAGAPDLATGEEALRRRTQALADLVQAVADAQAFVLVIDDLHWVDQASFRILEGVFGRIAGCRVLCLSAGRPERLVAGEGVNVLPIPPLTTAQVGSLVAALGEVPVAAGWAPGFADRMHAATRGSPLLVLETLRLAMDEGVLELDDAGWRCHDESRLASLLQEAEALRQRVRALPTVQRWTLALLGTYGSPLPVGLLATAMGTSVDDAAVTLASLERHGLARRTEAGWVPAHDEIEEANRSTLEPAERSAAERAIGVMLADSAGTDPVRLLRALRHLTAAGADALLGRRFRDYVRLVRARGDKRSATRIAADALGDADAGSAHARALAASLPMAWRAGLWSRARQVAAASFVAAAVGVAAVSTLARAARDAAMPRVVYTDSSRVARVARVDPADWNGRTDAVVPERGASSLVDAALAWPEVAPFISPDGRAAAWTQDSGDSTTLDIWIRNAAGTRRLTWQVRDDKVSAWLPDGSGVVGMTNRWTVPAEGNYDIAVFDTASGAARQITSAREHEGGAVPSPDGTRIAFVREYAGGPRLCVVPFDAISAAECRLPGGHPVVEIAGWVGLDELVLVSDEGPRRPLVRFDWQRDAIAPLFGPFATRSSLSPDRRWVLAAVQTPGVRGLRDWIVPLDHPARARRVAPTSASSVRWWEGAADRSLLVDRIEFTDTASSLVLGVRTRLAIRALTSAGDEIPARAPVRWSSSDTLVAAVDSTGSVLPRRP
ncbi:MAG TPA: AAA family ATPase, partial [Gemmatimonadaceae bacterium]|nr:AAA family ATPase [Gemmatimonadaceae bacterium]